MRARAGAGVQPAPAWQQNRVDRRANGRWAIRQSGTLLERVEQLLTTPHSVVSAPWCTSSSCGRRVFRGEITGPMKAYRSQVEISSKIVSTVRWYSLALARVRCCALVRAANVFNLLRRTAAVTPGIHPGRMEPPIECRRLGDAPSLGSESPSQAISLLHDPRRGLRLVPPPHPPSGAIISRTGNEGVRIFSTGRLPDGVFLKACGTRRESRCPSCPPCTEGMPVISSGRG